MENTLLKIKTKKIIFVGLGICAALIPLIVFGYSPYYTHPDLTAQMARLFNAKGGVGGQTISDQQIALMRQGAIDEDDPPRWINHFYDPEHFKGWLGKNLGTINSNVVYKVVDSMAPADALPSVSWVTDQKTQSMYRQQGNQTWQKAVHSYLHGDQQSAFIALGHVLHLVEDASVPEHTRNDTHVHVAGDPGSPYEDYSEKYTNLHALSYDTSLVAASTPNYPTLSAAFLGIAKYSNNNFFSENTFYGSDFSLPSISSLVNTGEYLYDPGSNIYVAKVIAENGHADTFTVNDDRIVLPSYRTHLFPRDILTGVTVIKLFFEEVASNLDGTYQTEPLYQPSFFETLGAQLGVPWFGTVITGVADIQAYYSQKDSDDMRAGKTLLADFVPTLSLPYSPSLFKPTTGTLSIAKESSPTKLAMGTVNSGPGSYLVDSSNVALPFVTNSAVVGELEQYVLPDTDAVPGTAGFSSTLYAQAPAVLAGNLNDGERSILSQALRGIGIDNNPANATATALLLTTALAGLGYVVRTRTENGVAVFDIVKTVPRTVYENVTESANILTPVTKQVVEYVTVPISEQYLRPVQVLKNVVETAYQWVQEAVPVLKQVARTVYEYVKSWIPETVKGWLGGIWQSITNWVEKVVPIAETVYDTVVETVYQWVQRPVAYVKQVMETVLEAATRMVEKTIPVVRDVFDFVSSPISNTYQRARTVYDEVVVGTIRTGTTQSFQTQAETVPEVPAVPINTAPRVPPNLFRDPSNGQDWMLTAGLSDFTLGNGGVARYISNQEKVKELYGAATITNRTYGEGSNGWDPGRPDGSNRGGGTSGGAMTLEAMWNQLPEVFTLGTAAQTIDAYAEGKPGTGHQMGWLWKPVEMIDPRSNIIYSVDATEDVAFQYRLGWRRTNTGLFTTEQLSTAKRSFESYDTVENYLAHRQYHA